MNKVISLVPIIEIETGAVDQLNKVSEYPFVEKIAVMPDIHQGYELPIGCACLTKDNVISPAMVGVDIGCGMSMLETGIILDVDTFDAETIMECILSCIPVGYNEHDGMITHMWEEHHLDEGMPKNSPNPLSSKKEQNKFKNMSNKSRCQIGTLGGGNHFIEVGSLNKTNEVVVTIHSGSRNPGHTIASAYKAMNDLDLPKGYLFAGSILGRQYLSDLDWATRFASANRAVMLDIIWNTVMGAYAKSLTHEPIVNETHNTLVPYDKNKWLHRKGTTSALVDKIGLIPISIKDGVYVTRGLGNSDYLNTASHGAGRKMSRNKAKKLLIYEKEFDNLSLVSNTSIAHLDEAPGAYKDAEYVIGKQEGVVVEIIDKTTPLIVVKG